MTEFVYNNAKNINTGNKSFKLNYEYHFCVFYKKDINSRPKFKATNKLSIKL